LGKTPAVSIELSKTRGPHRRVFCWKGQIRGGKEWKMIPGKTRWSLASMPSQQARLIRGKGGPEKKK